MHYVRGHFYETCHQRRNFDCSKTSRRLNQWDLESLILPVPVRFDSEPDTSNVSNDANQAKSPPVPTPPVPNHKFQEKWISLYPWLVHRALSLST